jgi:hypothetical protein
VLQKGEPEMMGCMKRLKSRVLILVDTIVGMMIGAKSSTFSIGKRKIDSMYGRLHEPWDCFTIVTPKRTFDLATTDFSAKLDVFLILTALLQERDPDVYPPRGTKYQYIVSTVKMKL